MKTAALCTLGLLGSPLWAQDFLLYKFDGSGVAGSEPNLATGASAFPSSGFVESNTGAPMTDGKFGGALAGGNAATNVFNRVRTGWVPSALPLTGDMTFAFWLRQKNLPGSLNQLCGTTLASGMRVLTGNIAGRGLYYRAVLSAGGNTGVPQDLLLSQSVADIQTLAAAGWVHVALVVDSTARTAQFYVDGVRVVSVANVAGARINSSGEFMLGFQGTANESNYDMDEFLLSTRAYSAADVQLLFTGPPKSGTEPYTLGAPLCGTAVLRGYGGRPDLGNADFGLELESEAEGAFMVFVGFQCDTLRGRVPLPLELDPFASGCWLLTDTETRHIGVKSGLTARVAMPIPAVLPSECMIYAQGFVVEFPGRRRGHEAHGRHFGVPHDLRHLGYHMRHWEHQHRGPHGHGHGHGHHKRHGPELHASNGLAITAR